MITENNRSISLSLRKPFFEHYLRYVFKCPCGPIKVSRNEDIGKYIYSRVRFSNLPVKQDFKNNNVINFILPVNEYDWYTCKSSFIYFTEEDITRINDFIESTAYLDFRLSVQVGVNEMTLDRKTVVSFFSQRLFGEDKFEMLKKDDYRRRKKMEEWLVESIQKFGT